MRFISVDGNDEATIQLSMEELGLLVNALWHELGYQEARETPIDPELGSGYERLESALRGVIDEIGLGGALPDLNEGKPVATAGDQQPSHPGVTKDRADQFVAGYFDEERIAREGSRAERLGIRDQLGILPFDQLNALLWGDPEDAERAWPLVLALVEAAPSDDALSHVGAGHLEDLVRRHHDRFGERILDQARTDPRFRLAMLSCWGLESLPEPFRGQLIAAIEHRDRAKPPRPSGHAGRRKRR